MALSAMGALGVAASFVWSGRRLANAAPGAVFVYRSAAALFLTLGFALGSGSGVTGVSGAYAWSVFAVSVVFTSLAFMAMFAGVDRIGATPAAMIMNLEPAMTVALAAVVLGETMTPMKLIGGAIVVAAVLVSQVAGLRGEVKGVVGKPRLHGKPPPRVGPGTSRAR
jgi:drug/metabolite transporter (DMT)-like permease